MILLDGLRENEDESHIYATDLASWASRGAGDGRNCPYSGIVSPENWVFQGGSPFSTSDYKNGGIHGAPGPIAGAGLPFLAVGYGVYWLIKRRRKAD